MRNKSVNFIGSNREKSHIATTNLYPLNLVFLDTYNTFVYIFWSSHGKKYELEILIFLCLSGAPIIILPIIPKYIIIIYLLYLKDFKILK